MSGHRLLHKLFCIHTSAITAVECGYVIQEGTARNRIWNGYTRTEDMPLPGDGGNVSIEESRWQVAESGCQPGNEC